MNFFSGLFPHFPGNSWGNTGTGVRRRSQSPAERTPIFPGKDSSTSRKKLRYSPKTLETDQEGKIYFIPQRRYLLSPEKIYFSRH